MVLPEALVRAAKRGDRAVVAAWLEAGGGVNDVDGDGQEHTLLLFALWGSDSYCGDSIGESNVATVRCLLNYGADVNQCGYLDHTEDGHGSGGGYTPLHFAAIGLSESSPAMVALLLKAGANVQAINHKHHNPFSLALAYMATEGPAHPRMEIVLMLLRAIPSLDCVWTMPGTGNIRSAEQMLDWAERQVATVESNQPLVPDGWRGTIGFQALRAVVAGVRAAGGWRAYDRKPREEVLRLRSLAQRRRAILLAAPTCHYEYPYIRSLDFLIRCPPEIAWHCLGFWRCQYPIETSIIDDLGVH